MKSKIKLIIDAHESKHFSIASVGLEENKVISGNDASAQIISKIEEIIPNFKSEEISEIIINLGPGSLTGLRIGSSIAQGLALGLESHSQLNKNIKVKGLSLWDVIFEEYPEIVVLFYTGTKKWIQKTKTEETIKELDQIKEPSSKWISNKPEKLPFSNNSQEFPNIIKLMQKHHEKAKEDINLLYPVTMF